MFCTKCGNPIKDADRYCPNCGGVCNTVPRESEDKRDQPKTEMLVRENVEKLKKGVSTVRINGYGWLAV